ncbi:MAG: GIY-YIG nuclease family protein [Thermoleophilia bacterium]
MDYQIKWHKPIKLLDGYKQDLIFTCEEKDLKSIPDEPGVYTFACSYGSSERLTPLYVGKTNNLQARIKQHFKGNVPLMNQIKKRKSSERYFIYGVLKRGRGQGRNNNLDKYLRFVEKNLIAKALEKNNKLFNTQGTIIKSSKIVSSGRIPDFFPSTITVSE